MSVNAESAERSGPIGHAFVLNRSTVMVSWIAALAIYSAISLPSLKLFLPGGELLNAIPLLLAVICLIVTVTSRSLHYQELLAILAYLAFFSLLLSSFVIDPNAFPNMESLFKYIGLAGIALLVGISGDPQALRNALALLVAWGVLLSVVQLVVGVRTGDGQHYLTVGLPIGAALAISIARLMTLSSHLRLVLHSGLALLFLAALMTLFGRGPLIFPFLAASLFVTSKVVIGPGARTRLRFFSLSVALIGAASYVYVTFIPPFIQERLQRMISTPTDEPRFEAVYIPAWETFIENPFGYGLEASRSIIGYYPHNIFMEISISSGIVVLLVFLFLVILFLASCFHFFKDSRSRPDEVAIGFVGIYLLLVWNVSFPLVSAYGLLAVMLLQSLLYVRERHAPKYLCRHSLP